MRTLQKLLNRKFAIFSTEISYHYLCEGEGRRGGLMYKTKNLLTNWMLQFSAVHIQAFNDRKSQRGCERFREGRGGEEEREKYRYTMIYKRVNT